MIDHLLHFFFALCETVLQSSQIHAFTCPHNGLVLLANTVNEYVPEKEGFFPPNTYGLAVLRIGCGKENLFQKNHKHAADI